MMIKRTFYLCGMSIFTTSLRTWSRRSRAHDAGLAKNEYHIEETHYFKRTTVAGRPLVLRGAVILKVSMIDCAIGGYACVLLKMFVQKSVCYCLYDGGCYVLAQ